MEGKAEIFEITKVAPPGNPKPGDKVVINGGVRNIGEKDLIKIVVMLLDESRNLIGTEGTMTMSLEKNGAFGYPIGIVIPATYTGTKVYAVATGFHEE